MKIEPGCMAIIMNSWAGNNGIIVTVGNYIGKVDGWAGNHRWEVDEPIQSVVPGFSSKHLPDYQLMRIDGFKEDKVKKESKELSNG